MKQKITTAILVIWAISLFGCAHGLMRGSVAMKTSENEAHVCLGNEEAKVGERVTAYRNDCPTKGSARLGNDGGGSCRKVKLGEGTITELLNEHYSVVRFDSNVAFNEGTFVEKQ